MRRNWKLPFLLLGLITVLLLHVSQSQRAQDRSVKQVATREQNTDEVDVNHFPIVEYLHEKRLEGIERTKRDKKGKKYNSGYAAPISESTDKVFTSIDWERGLRALPVERSSAVIIGEIIGAQAHLSEDQTKLYSEFAVRVNEVLKADKSIPLNPQTTISVERPGGRIRFPSGKVAVVAVSNQDLPRVGRCYVLFLTHDSFMGGRYEEDFIILTGYELRDGKVFPLDSLSPGHPISGYKGKDKESLLRDLAFAISNASLTK